jgi:hypothetical protein
MKTDRQRINAEAAEVSQRTRGRSFGAERQSIIIESAVMQTCCLRRNERDPAASAQSSAPSVLKRCLFLFFVPQAANN